MKDEFRSRRAVLRGALALGGSWWVSTLLSGCDSRKSPEPTTAAAPPPSASVAGANTPAATPSKTPQANVQYQAQPKDGKKCADCQNFIAESNTCKLVEGQISPDGWCTLWAKKT